MDIDATFLPVAELLVDQVFATPVAYRRISQALDNYDPLTGTVTKLVTEYQINAGVTSSSRAEQGGINESRTLSLWVHHGATGLPFLPETGDSVLYLGEEWKVTNAAPSYHSKGLIATKLSVSRCTPI